ncbi:hypothetical protein EZV62_026917 [Acer yangbiense]|uniref:Uncharacterized protein n=1 Tax=Acer yangbiense TaxID=1000413 RepID=A0A5C7GSJ5_9ROSI|nr:hypothetical protein EZV62_026917 [Acer yangbiense]
MQAKDDTVAFINKEKPSIKMYDHLLNLASGALAESSSKRNQISRRNHIGRHLYGNPMLIGELQFQVIDRTLTILVRLNNLTNCFILRKN